MREGSITVWGLLELGHTRSSDDSAQNSVPIVLSILSIPVITGKLSSFSTELTIAKANRQPHVVRICKDRAIVHHFGGFRLYFRKKGLGCRVSGLRRLCGMLGPGICGRSVGLCLAPPDD